MIRLTKNELSFLSMAFNAPTDISPFASVDGTTLGNEYSSLTEKGIIVNDSYSDEAARYLRVLEGAQNRADILVANNIGSFRMSKYKADNDVIRVDFENGEMVVSDYGEFDYALLNDYFPFSTTKITDIVVKLDPECFAALLAVFDFFRRNELLSLAGISSSEVMYPDDLLTSSMPWNNGLFTRIGRRMSLPEIRSDRVDRLIGRLFEEGLIEQSGNGFRLETLLDETATGSVIVDTEVMLKSGVSGKKKASNTHYFLICGTNNTLGIVFDGVDYTLTTASGSDVAREIERTLNAGEGIVSNSPSEPEPDIYPDDGMVDTVWNSNADAESGVRCPSCGAVMTGKDMYCRVCGSPMALEKICINCGTHARPDDRFCPKCGAKLDAES